MERAAASSARMYFEARALTSPKEELAAVLFEKMEHLEPSDDFDWNKTAAENWLALDGHSRAFYLSCIDALAAHPGLWSEIQARNSPTKTV
jgi:hypothetical protein